MNPLRERTRLSITYEVADWALTEERYQSPTHRLPLSEVALQNNMRRYRTLESMKMYPTEHFHEFPEWIMELTRLSLRQ